jgi:hypothetical protein
MREDENDYCWCYVTAQFWGAPAQHPAPTPVIGRGQTEAAGVCDYPTVIRTRTRTRPAR